MKIPLYLIDSYALIYRSYFAFMSRPLRNSSGENVSSLFGFAKLVTSMLNTVDPICLAAVFDSRGPTFRKEKFPAYKATRQKAPQDLHSQVPKVEEFLRALGVTDLRAEGFEADDIIATLAVMCKKEGRPCYILSSDKDLLQLVGGGVFELRPSKGGAPGSDAIAAALNYECVGDDGVKAEWGVLPSKILDLLSLTGDSSDNVPGVKGIGDKTAVKLLQRYGSLDEIYKNIAGIEGSVGKKLAENKENAYLSRDLITLVYDVPLKITNIDDLVPKKLDRAAAAAVLFREEIPSIAKQLSGESAAASNSAIPAESGAAKKTQSSAPKIVADESLIGDGVYKTILDIDELKEFFLKAKKQGFFAFDFETDSLDAWNANPVGVSLALKPKEAFYVPIGGGANKAGGLSADEVRGILTAVLSDPDMTVVAHNAKYDYEVSRGWGIERWQAKIWDTMVAAWVCDSDRNIYSLDSLASSYLSYTAIPFSSIVPKDGSFADVPLETACRYSAEDADLCVRIKLLFEPCLKEIGCLDLFNNLEMPLLPVLAEMEGVGIKIEGDYLKKYGVELGVELDSIQAETWALVGHEFNLASPKQLQEVLFTERKLKPTKKTKTGWSTDVAVLEELAAEDRVPELILHHRGLAKLKSTYVDTLADIADDNGRLHTSFIQTGTATGRLSSRDPNLQNIPIRDDAGRRIRAAFVAGEGNVLISADYSQIELVVLAHLSQDKNLVEAFTEGKDVHTRTAALIFGLDEKDVDTGQRRIAKVINFGVMYGMSSFRLSNELKIGRREAADFIDTYFATYSGVRDFIDRLIAETEKTGYVSTMAGRRRYIPTINSQNKTEKAQAERVAVNTPIQGTAADIVKKAMLDMNAAFAGNKSKFPAMLLQVHDELILECPKSKAEETVGIVRNVMEKAVKLSVPLHVSIETGRSWGDFH
jgi:DNA polymerase-1